MPGRERGVIPDEPMRRLHRDRLRDSERLREQAAGQRALVRWWAAGCRQRNALRRRRFTSANVAVASEARVILWDDARAWGRTSGLLRWSKCDRHCSWFVPKAGPPAISSSGLMKWI